MPTRAVPFEGKSYILPGARGAFRAKPQSAGISPDLNTMIIIGGASNGWDSGDTTLTKAKRAMLFGSFEEAKAVLVSGDLLDGIKAAFAPSKDSRFSTGAQRVYALNTNPNTAASGSFAHENSGTYTITARVPGPEGNFTRIKPSSSLDKLEIGDKNFIRSIEGLNVPDITVTYSGDASSASMDWDGSDFTTTLAGQGDGSANLAIAIADAPTLQDLANRINEATGYSAVVNTRGDIKLEDLDYLSGGDLVAAPVPLKSILAKQETFIKNTELAEVTVVGGRYPLSDATTFQYLTGGATGVGGDSDFLEAIEYQKLLTGLYLNVCSTSAAVHSALFDAIAWHNSPDGSNERFGGAGALQTDSLADRQDAGRSLNTEYMVFSISPVTNYQADGITEKDFDGWYHAILHNAIRASNSVRETAFNKDLNIIGSPEELTPTEKEQTLRAGCIFVDQKPTGAYRTNLDVTTYSGTNLILNKAQTICTALALNKDLRESLEAEFLGETPTDPRSFGTEFTDADIRQFVERKFDVDYIRNFGWLTQNIYTGEEAFDRNFIIRRDGNAIYFEFPDAKLVTSLDYIFSLLNLDVVRGTSTGG